MEVQKLGSGTFSVRQYATVGNLFDCPVPSSDLCIFTVKELQQPTREVSIVDILFKCYRVPHGDGFVVIPLIQEDMKH